jgi:hypothetical protein
MTSIEQCGRTLERREAAKRAHNRTLRERARGDAERIVAAVRALAPPAQRRALYGDGRAVAMIIGALGG